MMEIVGRTTMSSRETLPIPTKETVYSQAREVFGDASKAYSWMNTPNHAFKGMCPKDFIEYGNADDIRLAIEELARIDQGVF
jgi:uncharacterized protein (DUF2384 family)